MQVRSGHDAVERAKDGGRRRSHIERDSGAVECLRMAPSHLDDGVPGRIGHRSQYSIPSCVRQLLQGDEGGSCLPIGIENPRVNSRAPNRRIIARRGTRGGVDARTCQFAIASERGEGDEKREYNT